MNVYIVLMRRYGGIDSHAYVLGAFDNLNNAVIEAKNERRYRGFKHEYEIMKYKLNDLKYQLIISSNTNESND